MSSCESVSLVLANDSCAPPPFPHFHIHMKAETIHNVLKHINLQRFQIYRTLILALMKNTILRTDKTEI